MTEARRILLEEVVVGIAAGEWTLDLFWAALALVGALAFLDATPELAGDAAEVRAVLVARFGTSVLP
jgi:hypothetical protein